MKRIEALAVIDTLYRDIPTIVTCGATARELVSIADRPNYLFLLDSMGLTSAVGLGVALGHQGPVGVIDGDGSFLMGFSIAATLATCAPPNLTVVILDNGQHASAGGWPSQAATLDLDRALSGFGYPLLSVDSAEELESTLRAELSSERFSLIVAHIESGNTPDIPLLLADPVVFTRRFTDWLAEHTP